MAWVQEKLPSATAQDYGQSLSTVQHLQEKHQVLVHAGRLERVPLELLEAHSQGQDTETQQSLCFVEHLVPFGNPGVGSPCKSVGSLGPTQGVGSPIASTSLALLSLQNLENEISSHKALSQVVMGTGQKLVQAGHFAAEEVAARVQQLEAALEHLQTEAAWRRGMLQQALEAQQILMEVRRMLWDVGTSRECGT